MYSNLGTNLIKKYKIIDMIKHETDKKIILTPDIKIKTDQLKRTSKVCPISGWAANNIVISIVIKNVTRYLK